MIEPTKKAADETTDAKAPADTVATPEGDGEFAPDQPLKPIDDGQQKTPAIDTNKV